MRSVVDRNVVMGRMTVELSIKFQLLLLLCFYRISGQIKCISTCLQVFGLLYMLRLKWSRVLLRAALCAFLLPFTVTVTKYLY